MVDREQGELLAQKLAVPFFECSCKHNINIQDMFIELCQQIKDHLEQNVSLWTFTDFVILWIMVG